MRFSRVEEASAALQKHMQKLGHRYFGGTLEGYYFRGLTYNIIVMMPRFDFLVLHYPMAF